jgi:hypothetical protein
MIAAANRTARVLAASGGSYLHPNWSELQVQTDVIRQACG